MANTLSAKKALRQDAKKGVINLRIKRGLKLAIKTAKESKDEKDVLVAVKLIDKAAQHGSIKKNNAARKKSRLWKSIKAPTKTAKISKKKKK